LIETYVGIPLKDIELKKLAQDTIEVMVHHNLVLPSNLALMIKGLSMAETTGRQLDPDFNVVEMGRPYIAKILRKRFHPDELFKKGDIFVNDSLDLIEKLPQGMTDILRKLNDGKLKFTFENKESKKIREEIRRSAIILSLSIIIAALIISSSLYLKTYSGFIVFGYPIQSIINFIIAILLSIILIAFFRSKKRK